MKKKHKNEPIKFLYNNEKFALNSVCRAVYVVL